MIALIALIASGLALGSPAEQPDPVVIVEVMLPPLPEAPTRAPDQDGDCASKAAARPGVSRDCAAISVPPSYLAYLEEQRIFASQLQLRLVAVEAVASSDGLAADREIAWRDQRISDLQEPVPFFQRPGTLLGGGLALGVLTAVAAGIAMGQASQ